MVRNYPSNQDTNLTAKGSLILSIDNTIDYVDIYVNDNLVKRQYPIVSGLFEVGLNINDVVRIESLELIEVLINRKDYTTDDSEGNLGIIETPISGTTSAYSFTFTATTISSGYNFEYLLFVDIGGPKASLIFTYKTDITKNLGSALINANYFWVGGFAPGGPPPVPPTTLWNFVLGSYQFSGDTTTSYNLGNFPLSGMTNVPFLGSVTTQICYTTKDGLIVQGLPDSFFKIYVNNVLQNSTTYTTATPGFGIVGTCSPSTIQTTVYTDFSCSNGDVVEFVFEDNFTIQDSTPTPTPTPVPVPGYFDAAFSTSGFTGTSPCFDAPIYNFSGSSINLATCDYVSGTIISTAPVDGVFILSVGTAFREYRRQGSSNIGYKTSNFTLLCPTRTPTPTPTLTPTPTGAPTFTPTPTPTITPTPVPITGYTNGYSILVNGFNQSYPGTGTVWTSIATGTTYNATLVNGPIWTGGTPSYFTFDGVNDYADFGISSTGATTASCSFGAWFKTTTSATQKVVAMRGLDNEGNGWSLLIAKQSNNKMGVGVVRTVPSTSGLEVNSTTTLVNNTWYYVYGVWTAGTNLKIYVNGSLENTGSITGNTLRTSTFGWTLARSGASPQYNDVSIGEFITYNRVLSDAEILANYNGTKAAYGY